MSWIKGILLRGKHVRKVFSTSDNWIFCYSVINFHKSKALSKNFITREKSGDGRWLFTKIEIFRFLNFVVQNSQSKVPGFSPFLYLFFMESLKNLICSFWGKKIEFILFIYWTGILSIWSKGWKIGLYEILSKKGPCLCKKPDTFLWDFWPTKLKLNISIFWEPPTSMSGYSIRS